MQQHGKSTTSSKVDEAEAKSESDFTSVDLSDTSSARKEGEKEESSRGVKVADDHHHHKVKRVHFAIVEPDIKPVYKVYN